jgi:hypothetical protein
MYYIYSDNLINECDVTESAILGGWYRGVTVRV